MRSRAWVYPGTRARLGSELHTQLRLRNHRNRLPVIDIRYHYIRGKNRQKRRPEQWPGRFRRPEAVRILPRPRRPLWANFGNGDFFFGFFLGGFFWALSYGTTEPCHYSAFSEPSRCTF